MAAADMAITQYGYVVGGTDTDARTVSSGDIYVKRILLSANASADTTVVTDGTNTLINFVATGTAGGSQLFKSVEIGARLPALVVTQSGSAANHRTTIIVE